MSWPTRDVVLVRNDGSTVPARLLELSVPTEATACISGQGVVEVRDLSGELLFARSASGELVKPSIPVGTQLCSCRGRGETK